MKIYGLIGKTLGHSFSQKYFTEKFLKENISNCIYRNFEIKDADKEIPDLKILPGLSGLNVTIPYKSTIISFLDELTKETNEINACNCIKIVDGKWIGYNTDIIGFKNSFAPNLKPYHNNALILGTGGASKAVAFVLKKLGISFVYVSRNKSADNSIISYEEVSEKMLSEYKIVINTTPLGMFPDEDQFPPLPYNAVTNPHYFFDLIYNPKKTLFLAKAEQMGAMIGNGEKMLQIQAEESWKIWNS